MPITPVHACTFVPFKISLERNCARAVASSAACSSAFPKCRSAASSFAARCSGSADASSAARIYSELFGWALLEPSPMFQPFAWRVGEPSVGAFADIAGRPELHPHWLFFFGVDALDAALARVRAAGGVVNGPTALPDGRRVAACEDPQGAAFGLIER